MLRRFERHNTPTTKELMVLADSRRFTQAAAPCPLSWAAWTLCRQTYPARRSSNAERLPWSFSVVVSRPAPFWPLLGRFYVMLWGRAALIWSLVLFGAVVGPRAALGAHSPAGFGGQIAPSIHMFSTDVV